MQEKPEATITVRGPDGTEAQVPVPKAMADKIRALEAQGFKTASFQNRKMVRAEVARRRIAFREEQRRLKRAAKREAKRSAGAATESVPKDGIE